MPGPAPLRLPSEVAELLRCSEWWVKEQARRGRIPHSRIGGGYRFTDEHVAEIVRIFEHRPGDQPAAPPAPRRAVQRPDDGDGSTVVYLKARTPRRARTTGIDRAA
ncbi:MAG TPA: helix-turn-helix domain-containing protein [Candidatus Limnocylindrales bacterium]